jgi:hypothetical protein
MKNKFKLLFLGLGLVLFACKKEETVTPAALAPTTKELLTATTWKLTNYATTSSDTSATNEIKSWNEDIKSNTLYVTYQTNGTYAYSDSSDYGVWELSNDKTILYNKGTVEQSTASIDKLTATDFILSYDWTVNDSLTVKVTETAVKK